jgi:hypothetical protein
MNGFGNQPNGFRNQPNGFGNQPNEGKCEGEPTGKAKEDYGYKAVNTAYLPKG